MALKLGVSKLDNATNRP